MNNSITSSANSNQCINFLGRKVDGARLGCNTARVNPEKLPHKRYVVIDTFESKDMDIDGDGKDDISHGEFIARLIKSLNPKAEAIKLDEGKLSDGDKYFTYWDDLVKQIKELRPDGVNRSTGGSLGYPGTSKLLDEPITKDNFMSRLGPFRQYLEQQDDQHSKFFLFIVNHLEELTKNGIKVFNSGGNKGIKFFNFESVAEGVNIVGSTDARGNLLECSADNARMNFAQGIYGISQVKDKSGKLLGYDIVGNGNVSITPEEVSSGGSYVDPKIQQFAGKALKDCLITDEEFEALKIYYSPSHYPDEATRNKVKEIQERDPLLSLDQIQLIFPHNQELAQYREVGVYKTLFGKVAFDVDKDGKVIYDPDRSGRQNVIHYARGASFASPTFMVMKDIEEACK